MTIAAGILHNNGLLLCADTELTSGDLRLHASKLARVECPYGRVGMVCAGNFYNAVSTMQKIARALHTLPPNEHPLATCESVLQAEYPRIVWQNPGYATGSFDFWLIFAVQPRLGPVELFVSYENTIRAGQSHETAGSGSVVARQIIEAGGSAVISADRIAILATYMLSHTKRHASGVGGMSLMIDFGNDGTVTELYEDQYLKRLEGFFGVYQMFTWELALAATDPTLSDDDFAETLRVFDHRLVSQRSEWVEARARHLKHREAYRTLTTPKAAPIHQSPKHGRKSRPASRA